MAEPQDSIPKPQLSDNIIKQCILLYGHNYELNMAIINPFHPLTNVFFEDCCLINSKWIKKFKDIYNYEKISELMMKYQNFRYKSYLEFEKNVLNIFNTLKSFGITQKEVDLNNELSKIPFFPEKIENNTNSIYYYKDFFIVNSKIRDGLYSLYNNIGNNSNSNEKTNFSNLKCIFINKDNQIINFGNELEIGKIDKDGMFSPKYYLRFYNKGYIENEINYLINHRDLDNYLQTRSINNFLQNILAPNYGNIGTFLNIIKYEESNKNNLNNSSSNNTSNYNKTDSQNNYINRNNPHNNYKNVNNNNYNNKLNSNTLQNNNPIDTKYIKKNNINISNNDNINVQTKIISKEYLNYKDTIKTKYGFNPEETMKMLNANNVFTQIKKGKNNKFKTCNDNKQLNKGIIENNNNKGQNNQSNYKNQPYNNYNNNQQNNNFNNNQNIQQQTNNMQNMNNNQQELIQQQNMNNQNYPINNNMNNSNMNNQIMNNQYKINNNFMNNQIMQNNFNPQNFNQMNNSNNFNQMNNSNNFNQMNNNFNNFNQMNNFNNFNQMNNNFNNFNQMNNFNNFNQMNNNFNNYNQMINYNNLYQMNNFNNQMFLFNNQNLFNNNQNNDLNNNDKKRPKTAKEFYNQNLKGIKELNYVPMIGLENLGKTCYMNSVLQCFSNISKLTNYFLDPSKQIYIKSNSKTLIDEKEPSITVEYKELIDNLWKGMPKVAYSPFKFKKVLGKLNALFKDDTAGDSKDLACYLIMEIHNELNNIDTELGKKSAKNKKILDENKNVNPYDPKEVFDYFINNFIMNQNSIITEIFYGINRSMFECQVCKFNCIRSNIKMPLLKYNYENFFYLEFPLNEVRKFVAQNMNMGMNYQNINEVTIYDCFNYNRKQNEMEGYCERCGSDNAKIFSMTQIYSPPNIMMIIFNRGKGLQYDIKVNFPLILDLSQIVLNCGPVYELQGVIKHLGDNSASGHFIAYCRTPVPIYNNNWYCYNDNTVVESNDWNSIHNVKHNYILFYQLK